MNSLFLLLPYLIEHANSFTGNGIHKTTNCAVIKKFAIQHEHLFNHKLSYQASSGEINVFPIKLPGRSRIFHPLHATRQAIQEKSLKAVPFQYDSSIHQDNFGTGGFLILWR